MVSGAATTTRTLVKHRRLLLEMARRDLSDRYSGQIFGVLWAFLHPATAVAVFLFIFGVVFQAKASSLGVAFPADHAIYMVSGLLPWLVAVEVLSRAPATVTGQASLVKQVVFPLEVLPTKMTMATLPTIAIGLIGLMLYALIRYHTLPTSYLLLPLAIALVYLFLTGLAFLTAAVAVFFRDLKDVVQLYTFIGLYLAPIFYFIEWVPEQARFIVFLNPMTYFVMMFHDIAYYGDVPSFWIWAVCCGLSAVSLLLGTAVFSRLKHYFGSFL